jgi:hypothetical protein
MSKKKKGLSPETIKKLQRLKRDKSEGSQRFSELKLKPFCNLAEVKKEVTPPIEKPLKVAHKVLKKPKKPSPKPPQANNGDVAIQHQQKTYKAGWNYERAEQARQRIAISKPWLYSTGAITNLGKKIVSRNALKHGLYSKVLQSSNLESIELSVTPADLQLTKEINYTQNAENRDILKG